MTTQPAKNLETKGARTRERILNAATRLFAERGYDGASIRDIEDAANVNRGVVTYHFGNKDDIWKAMFQYAFTPYLDDLRAKTTLLAALEPAARARIIIEHFIRTSAKRPEMNRLMTQENFAPSWRTEWIAENFLKPLRALYRAIAPEDPFLKRVEGDPNFRYALLGACNLVFSHPCEVRALYGKETDDEHFIAAHVETVTNLFEPYFRTT